MPVQPPIPKIPGALENARFEFDEASYGVDADYPTQPAAVEELGMVRGQEKVSLCEACDLFVLPTMQENFGLVLVEAMGAGLPLITTSQVDIWPELEAAGGTIVDRTAEAFTEAIVKMLSDIELRRKCAAALRKKVEENFTLDKMARATLAVYEEATK